MLTFKQFVFEASLAVDVNTHNSAKLPPALRTKSFGVDPYKHPKISRAFMKTALVFKRIRDKITDHSGPVLAKEQETNIC